MKIKPLYVLGMPLAVNIIYTLLVSALLGALRYGQYISFKGFLGLLVLHFIEAFTLLRPVYIICFFVSSYIYIRQQNNKQNEGSQGSGQSTGNHSLSDTIFERIVCIVGVFTLSPIRQGIIMMNLAQENQSIDHKNKVVDLGSKSIARIVNTILSAFMLPILINTYLYLVKGETIGDRILNQRIVNNKNGLKPSLKWLLVREAVKGTGVIYLGALILFCGMLFGKLFANRLLLNESAIAAGLYSAFNTLFAVGMITSLINVCSIMLDKNKVGLHEKRTNTTVIINSI